MLELIDVPLPVNESIGKHRVENRPGFDNIFPAMSDLTPRDEVKKQVSEILKRVDAHLKKGDIPQAMAEIGNAKQLDPRNIYAIAYEERIHQLEEQERKNAEARKVAEENAKKNAEEERLRAEALHKLNEERQKAIIADRLRADEELRKAAAAAPKVVAVPSPAPARADAFDIYRRLLRTAWADGVATEDEERQLRELRTSLAIEQTDHDRLEKEVRMEYYTAAFKKNWTGGITAPGADALLSNLRKRLRISLDEHEAIKARIVSERPKPAEKKQTSILVIDDDVKLLEIIGETIESGGHDVQTFSTSDDAFSVLKDGWTPDLILCDINLESSTMGGFTFYEKIREFEHLAEVPFVFLTGLTDEVLIRAGKELGVDDYLTKPISAENLLATIKGKLKRFKQLKRSKKKDK